MRNRLQYQVYVWHGKELSTFDDIKQAVELATKYSKDHDAVVVIWDYNAKRACAYGFKGIGYWTTDCVDCARRGCKHCLTYGFNTAGKIDWLN